MTLKERARVALGSSDSWTGRVCSRRKIVSPHRQKEDRPARYKAIPRLRRDRRGDSWSFGLRNIRTAGIIIEEESQLKGAQAADGKYRKKGVEKEGEVITRERAF